MNKAVFLLIALILIAAVFIVIAQAVDHVSDSIIQTMDTILVIPKP